MSGENSTECVWNKLNIVLFSIVLLFGAMIMLLALLLLCFVKKSRNLDAKLRSGRGLPWPKRTSDTNLLDGANAAKAEGGAAKPPVISKAPSPGPRTALPKETSKKDEKKQESKKSKKEKVEEKKEVKKEEDKFQAPATGDKPDMADAKDPNYRSLKGLGNDVFDKKGEEKAEDKDKPKENQYESLANLEKAVDPPEEAKKPKFRPPDKIEKVGAKNPQYETLAGLDDQLFKKKEPPPVSAGKEEEEEGEAAKPKKLPFKRPEMGKVSAKNPQYETFADVADDIFKGNKKE